MNLPPLPEQAGWLLMMHGSAVSFESNAGKSAGFSPGASMPAYTADQVLAIRAEAVRVALEQAAQVCEANALEQTGCEGEAYDLALSHAAAAIRALKEQA